MKFFVDNNLSPKLAAGMLAFGEEVAHLTDHFDKSADDREWIPWLGKGDWFLISRDLKIRFKPAEKLALVQHKVGAFLLGGKNRSRCQLIMQLVKAWPHIKECARNEKRPFVFGVPSSGVKLKRYVL